MSETNNGLFKAEIIAEIKKIQSELNELKSIKKEIVKKSTTRKPAKKSVVKKKEAKRKPSKRVSKEN